MNTREKILTRLKERAAQPRFHKFFNFSMEDLKDNPECVKEIEDYLETHKDKIENFHIYSWIDEDTFRPIVMLSIKLKDSSHMICATNLIIDILQNELKNG